MTKHKEVCLSINSAQSARLGKGIIGFKKFSKQIPVPFKFYAHFECKKLWRFLIKKNQHHIPCSFAYNLFCVDDRFSKSIVTYRGENAAFLLKKD